MTTPTYTRLVERESTHAVYRKDVQLRLRSGEDPAHQARLVDLALSLAGIARSFDPAFSARVEPASAHEILVEFELNFPDRFASAVNEWLAEEAKMRPEILDFVVSAER